MLSETGHSYRTFAGSPYNPFRHRSFIAARPGVMEALETAIRQGYGLME
jgi:hypothetical protein